MCGRGEDNRLGIANACTVSELTIRAIESGRFLCLRMFENTAVGASADQDSCTPIVVCGPILQ